MTVEMLVAGSNIDTWLATELDIFTDNRACAQLLCTPGILRETPLNSDTMRCYIPLHLPSLLHLPGFEVLNRSDILSMHHVA
jgi:hypothetical protein